MGDIVNRLRATERIISMLFTPCERRCVVSNQYFGDDRIVHEPLNVPKASSRRIYPNSEVSDDIVTRLNIDAAWIETSASGVYQDIGLTLRDAADEIERLRTSLSELENRFSAQEAKHYRRGDF